MFESHYLRLSCRASGTKPPLTPSSFAPHGLGFSPIFATYKLGEFGWALPLLASDASSEVGETQNPLLSSASSEPCFQGDGQHPALWFAESNSERSCHRWEPAPPWSPSLSGPGSGICQVEKALRQTHEACSPACGMLGKSILGAGTQLSQTASFLIS